MQLGMERHNDHRPFAHEILAFIRVVPPEKLDGHRRSRAFVPRIRSGLRRHAMGTNQVLRRIIKLAKWIDQIGLFIQQIPRVLAFQGIAARDRKGVLFQPRIAGLARGGDIVKCCGSAFVAYIPRAHTPLADHLCRL